MREKTGHARRLTLWIPFLLLVLPSFSACEIPGCGPGEIPRNPISSNLVDYTVPASQSILRPSLFSSFEIFFLRPVSKESFNVTDDLAMCRLEPGETECDFSDPSRRIDVGNLFTSAEWLCYTSSVCRPGSADFNMGFSDWLRLSANSSLLTPAKYLLRILKNGGSPLESREGHHLADDVDVYLEIVSEDSPRERPQVAFHNLEGYLNGAKWLEPHYRIKLFFDRPMGFVNFLPSPLLGFNFRYLTAATFGVVGIESDSVQGLSPGQTFSLDIIGDNVASESKGLPPTMDWFGNALADTLDLEFTTSHVRILFPFHEPFPFPSDSADDWYGQLEKDDSLDSPYVLVEVTPEVVSLSSVGPEGRETDIPFAFDLAALGVPAVRAMNVVVSLPIDTDRIQAGSVGYQSSLNVNAYGSGGVWLGADSLRVYAFPPAPKEIKIVTYNAYSHNYIGVPDVPPECQEPPWPAECFPCWLDGGDPDICQSEECLQQWPEYCYDFWPRPPPGAINWRVRLDNFARDIVAVYRPAIIAVQEVYHDSEGCWEAVCTNCEDISRGTWLRQLLQSIQQHLWPQGGRYHIATTLKSHVGAVCFGNEWEGNAIIYDSEQVLFIPSYPLEPGDLPYGCYEWSWGLEEYYEFGHYDYSDCLTKSGNSRNADVSRAIFEFPRGSGYFFSLYNTHPPNPCGLGRSMDWIKDRQRTFRGDLLTYLDATPTQERLNGIYPPVFAGDMNTQLSDCFGGCDAVSTYLENYFVDAPQSDCGWFDKVLVGIPEAWEYDSLLDVVQPDYVDPPIGAPFDEEYSKGVFGYRVRGERQIYSDHSPAMVVIRTHQEP